MGRKKPIKISGLDQILKQLDGFGDSAIDLKKEVLTEAGKHLLKEVKEAAPVDPKITSENKLYGNLKENIELEWNDKNATLYLTSGDAYWSLFVELGYPGYEAEPFMEPTFISNKTKMKKIIEKEVQKRLGL